MSQTLGYGDTSFKKNPFVLWNEQSDICNRPEYVGEVFIKKKWLNSILIHTSTKRVGELTKRGADCMVDIEIPTWYLWTRMPRTSSNRTLFTMPPVAAAEDRALSEMKTEKEKPHVKVRKIIKRRKRKKKISRKKSNKRSTSKPKKKKNP